MQLVIVESPTKAKTITKFLGSGFTIKASFGHIRDLPKNDIGIDVKNNFEPRYVIPMDKRKVVSELKKSAKKAKEILFATDSDREGEAIAWHLAHIFEVPEKKVKRLVFHEITADAIRRALESPRPLDLNMVNAQQARRVLDRLVGYELSPFLWKKIARGLSAGRVQSVAVRLIVEREREIQKFIKEEYWTVEAIFNAKNQSFAAKLHRVKEQILPKLGVKNEEEAKKILADLQGASYRVLNLERKTLTKTPPPPFTTSSLQQEANHRLGFSAKQTMVLAQQLYEGVDLPGHGATGLITYMRTDSVNLAEKFVDEAREFLAKRFGKDYLPEKARRYKNKSKNAQEAHEAIRPTEPCLAPADLKSKLEPRQWRLYDLIWRRAMATQMAAAIVEATGVDIADPERPYTFRASGNVIKFPGFWALYPEQQKENQLPDLKTNENVELQKIEPFQHFTEPPARYSDATLIKDLEEYGIGRPSTYAPTISTIIARRYVERADNRRLQPTEMAFLVNDLLVQNFPQIVDYKFTAKMEDELDAIAKGENQWQEVLRQFHEPFEKNLQEKYRELDKKELTEEKTEEKCELCQAPMIIKIGRYGRFLACSRFPDCRFTKPLARPGEAAAAPRFLDEKCPECGAQLQRRHGRYGEFISCSAYPKCKYIKKEQKSIGVKCPECGQGDLVERRSRRRKLFFSCSRYPDCKFALWNRPTGEKCPKCGALMTQAGLPAVLRPALQEGEKAACSNKECK